MHQKDKELLIRDLSARLPYNVVIHTDFGDYKMIGLIGDRVFTDCEEKGCHNDFPIDVCKPYLRPMSSMTEEEKSNYHNYRYWIEKGDIEHCTINMIDWLNAHHFDYRGLIPKGLALPALESMYKKTLNNESDEGIS